MTLDEFRAQNPAYADKSAWPDAKLAESLYQKFYASGPHARSRDQFYSDIGYAGATASPEPTPKAAIAAPPAPSPLQALQQGIAGAPSDVAAALGFIGQQGLGMAKSLASIPQAQLVDPLAQLLRLGKSVATGGLARPTFAQEVAQTPEEKARQREATVASVGLLAGGPVAGVPLPNRMLQTAAAGGAMSAVNAALTPGMTIPKALTQTGIGYLLGAPFGLIPGHGKEAVPAAEPPSPMMPPVGAAERALSQMHELNNAGVEPGVPENVVTPGPVTPGAGAAVVRSPLGVIGASVSDRLKALGEAGKQIEQMGQDVAEQSQVMPGATLAPFDAQVHAVAGKSGKLTPDQRSLLTGALERGVNPDTLPPELRAMYDTMRGFEASTLQRGTDLNVMVRQGEKSVPLSEAAAPLAGRYFPHRVPSVQEVERDADLVNAMARNLQDNGLVGSQEEGLATVKDWLDGVKSGGRSGGQKAIAVLQRANPGLSASAAAKRLFQKSTQLRQPASGLEFGREINSPFYDPRPEVAFPKDVVDKERALAEIEHYGQDTGKLTALLQQVDPAHRQEAEHLVRTMTETQREGDPNLARALAFARRLQLGLFTPVTALKNVTQRANTLLTSDADMFLRHGIIPTAEARRVAARSGALAEGSHETLAQALGTQPGFMERWLKAIGFEPAERGNRQTTAMTGSAEYQKYAKRLAENPNDALAAYRVARMGESPEVAALRRSNLAQFRSHPLDLPDWFTSHPVTRTLALFKGFDYQQTRLVLDETLGRMVRNGPGDRARALRNLGILATVYPALGEAVNDMYSIVSRRESPGSVAKRTKEFIEDTAKTASGKMDVGAYIAKYKGRYAQDVLSGSAPGTAGSIIQTLQYGGSDPGRALMRYLAGPVVTRPIDAGALALTTAGRIEKGKSPMTPAQKRQALRVVLGGPGSMLAPYLVPQRTSRYDQ